MDNWVVWGAIGIGIYFLVLKRPAVTVAPGSNVAPPGTPVGAYQNNAPQPGTDPYAIAGAVGGGISSLTGLIGGLSHLGGGAVQGQYGNPTGYGSFQDQAVPDQQNWDGYSPSSGGASDPTINDTFDTYGSAGDISLDG
jgi:hypothetical protein